ncbi:glycosyl transferase [Jannaschia rubra]|uniref:glycosyl transferase n=1 Tax=Jannaschia rubra TaxID=282197 RepID=UPI002491D6A0|nr:glycosyl transferase [Jannaschia rubra]
MDKQIICINWGTRYGARYINNLHAMVARNITPPFRFHCFTDVREGVHPDVVCHDLPPMPGAVPRKSRGKWQKARLWASDLGGLSGQVLFLDLDVVVTGSLDPFFTFGNPDDVVLARNMAKPLHRLGQTSIYRMPVGKLAPLQEMFAADPEGVAAEYIYEQHFVTRNAPGGIVFWPRSWVRHFRIECIRNFPLNYVLQARKPKDARVVIFAGKVNPPDAILGQYDDKTPHLSRRAHIARALRSKRKLTALRSYLLPTDWVREAWQMDDPDSTPTNGSGTD